MLIPFQFLSALKCLQLAVFLFSSENIIIVVFRTVVSNTCYSITVRWAPSWGYYIHFYMRYWFVIFLPWSLLSIKIMDKKTSWIKRVYPSLSNIDLDFFKLPKLNFPSMCPYSISLYSDSTIYYHGWSTGKKMNKLYSLLLRSPKSSAVT